MTHGLRQFQECEKPNCPSCLKYVERPIQEKRGPWISQLGRPAVPVRSKKHPSLKAYNSGCRCVRCVEEMATYRAIRKAK